MKYTYKKFRKEFESHLGGFGVNTLFHHINCEQGIYDTDKDCWVIDINPNNILEWNFKTSNELMDIGCELFKQEMLENKRSSFSNYEVEERIGKDNILDVRDLSGFIGYLVKGY